jgi:hypothetical protein
VGIMFGSWTVLVVFKHHHHHHLLADMYVSFSYSNVVLFSYGYVVSLILRISDVRSYINGLHTK